jgi:hypothetical protein
MMSEWISVKDYLPAVNKSGRSDDVFSRTKQGVYVLCYIPENTSQHQWFDGNEGYYLGVTHWMPLSNKIEKSEL